MLRLASVGLLVGVSALAAPGGKVVRIERNRGLRTIPRICEVAPVAKNGNCLGQPSPGERVALIDQERALVLGEFRINEAGPAQDAAFACPGVVTSVFRIAGVVSSGDPDVIADSGRVIGLRNLSLDPKVARVLKDQNVPNTQDRADLALDIDGNGRVDYLLFRYFCDEANNPVQTSDRRLCFDTYLERGGHLSKAHTENIQLCY